MKIRMFIVFALLVGAVALSSVAAKVKITCLSQPIPEEAYLRVYLEGQDPPHLTEIELPAFNDSKEFTVVFSDSYPPPTIIAELYADGFHSTSAVSTEPYTLMFFIL